MRQRVSMPRSLKSERQRLLEFRPTGRQENNQYGRWLAFSRLSVSNRIGHEQNRESRDTAPLKRTRKAMEVHAANIPITTAIFQTSGLYCTI